MLVDMVLLAFQVVVALCWVDNDLSVHEEFIGLYAVSSIESSSLVHVIKDTLLRLGLPMTKISGQNAMMKQATCEG